MHPVAKNYVATVGGSSVKTEAPPHPLSNTPTAELIGPSGLVFGHESSDHYIIKTLVSSGSEEPENVTTEFSKISF